MAKNIDILLFDLGGVIINIDFNRVFDYWYRQNPSSALSLDHRLSLLSSYQRHECGDIDFNEFYVSICESLQLDLSEKQFLTGWNRVFLGLVSGIEEILDRIPKSIPKFVFSNTNRVHEQKWRKEYSDVLSHFNQVYTSVDLGKRKPDKEAYFEVLKRIGVSPEQVLFFDDSGENIEGAKKLGIESTLVRSNADILESLNKFAILK